MPKYVEKHPMQPIKLVDGVARFEQNDIVRYLLDSGEYDLNKLSVIPFTKEDWNQFYQLIGYSVSGFSDLQRADPTIIKIADAAVKRLLKAQKGR